MKKILLFVLIGAMITFTACQKNDPAKDTTPSEEQDTTQGDATTPSSEVSLQLPLDGFPIMDGSTACIPLMTKILEKTAGIDEEEAKTLVEVSTTAGSWANIIGSNVDINFAYEPSDKTKDEVGFEDNMVHPELDIRPIGIDALVFLTNKENPVDNLTTQQLIDIYSGKITNWKEVGGDDVEIIAYQRNETSGSQSLFKKLLMKDVEPMSPPTDLRPEAMGMLIDSLAQYNNTANALGYSVYFYAKEMYKNPDLKFIAIDGVAPSEETIGDGTYAFPNPFFVAVRKDAQDDTPERKLYDWLATPEGIALVQEAGYVPAK